MNIRSIISRQAILLLWTTLLIITFILLAWGAFKSIETGRRLETQAALQTVLDTSHQAFITWAREERTAVRTWAESPDLVLFTRDLLKQKPSSSELINMPSQAKLRGLLSRVIRARGYEGFFILSLGGVNLSASNKENIGAMNLLAEKKELMAKLIAGDSVLSLPQLHDVPLNDVLSTKHPAMFVSSPISGITGDPIAILTFQLDPSRDFTEIFQRGRIGRSGETYAFDGRGRLISESRFDDQLRDIGMIPEGRKGLLNIEIRDPTVNLVEGEQSSLSPEAYGFTKMAESAIAGKSDSDVEGYRDYRGVRVVGAWLWDHDYQFGITTEIDVVEAFETLEFTRWVTIAMTVIGTSLMVSVAVLFTISQQRAIENAVALEQALTKVLGGYLSICANCKKIKDDDGKWLPVEKYVGERTDAAFSHGICPECGEALYGDLGKPQ